MKIGIIGSGIVGQTLAKAFMVEGNQVLISSRDHQKIVGLKTENPKIETGNFNEAANYGELLVLAVKGSAASEVLKSIEDTALNNKVIIDATNPISDEAVVDGVLNFFTEQNHSLMEELQAENPDAHFVKAFNSIGSAHMYKPQFDGTPSMFICGNHQEAKQRTAKILKDFGWEVEDMGSARAAGAIESLCMLWCIPGFNQNQWSHAFKLIK